MDRRVLLHRFCMETAGHDRRQVHRFQTDDLVIKLIRFHRLAIDLRIEINRKAMRPVALLRDRERLLPAGNRSHGCADLPAIQNEVHILLDISHRCVRKTDRPGIGCRIIKARREAQYNHGDGKV